MVDILVNLNRYYEAFTKIYHPFLRFLIKCINSKITRKFNANRSKKKKLTRSQDQKFGKTLATSNDDFKANIDSICKSLYQSSIYFTIHLLYHLNFQFLKCFSDLFEIKHAFFYILVHLIKTHHTL